MIVGKVLQKFPIGSSFTRLIIGSVLTALVISLSIVGILKLFGFAVDPVIPAVLAVIGTAAYATRMRK